MTHDETLARLDRIGRTLADPTPARQPRSTDEPELHEMLAAELAAAQSRWFTWDDLAKGSDGK